MDDSVMRKIAYRISSNLSNKWGKHGWKFIYAMRKITAFTWFFIASVFKKNLFTQ